MNNLFGKVYQWGSAASYSDTSISVWLYGLALILIIAFLWSTVVRQVLTDVASNV